MAIDPDPTVRYFAAHSCVSYRGEQRAVFVGGSLIGTYSDREPVQRDVLIAAVCEDPGVRVGRVATAFDVSRRTLSRILQKFARGGVQALAQSHRRGRPRCRTPRLEQRLFELFDAGASVSEAHGRIKGRVSRASVGRVREQWAAQRAPTTPVEQRSATPSAVEQAAPDGDPSTEPTGRLPEEPTGAELELEQAIAAGGPRVQYLGSWIMLAMLEALGLYAVAEGLRARVARERRQRGQRFISHAALRAALDAVAVALSIGKRCVEGVRWLATPSGATLLRRAEPMSATWTRRVLGRLASHPAVAVEFHWRQALSLLETAGAAEERAVFYVDNHLRPYTGKHTIRRGWRMQDKRVRPGVTDYYVHDEEGRPLLRLDDPAHGALTDWLGPVGRLLREALGGKTRVLLAFDRAGAFVEQLASLRDDGLELVTYERGPYRSLPARAFERERPLTVGPQQVRFVEGPHKNLGKGRGRVRRIHVLTDDGAQLSVLAVSTAPARQLVTVLLSRWSYQENQFKHDNERWGINQLDGRTVERYPADEVIPNPARRRLDRALKIARAVEGEALRKLATLAEEDPRREVYEQDVEQARRDQDELEALRPAVPTHAPVSETELADKLVRHPGQYKMVLDTLRVALANVESDLAAWLGPELPRATEAKKTLAKLLDATGTIRLNRRTITIALEPAGTRAEQLAFEALLGRLNTLALHLPGDPSSRALRFQLAIK